MAADQARINKRITGLGEQYWQRMKGEMPSLFNSHYRQGHLLDWVMDDEAFQVDVFLL
ncbi:MAG: hypothetical protein ABFS09_11525 [Thermodesulfobacteriota bacterium]